MHGLTRPSTPLNQDSAVWKLLNQALRWWIQKELQQWSLWAFMSLPSLLFEFHNWFPKAWSATVGSEALKAKNEQHENELWKCWVEAEIICIHEYFAWKPGTFQGSCTPTELVWMIIGRAVTMARSRIYWNNSLWQIVPITCSATVMTIPTSYVAWNLWL